MQRTIGRPLRLHDCFRRFARRNKRGLERAFVRHIGDEKPRPVPRHAGMIPGDPGQSFATGRKSRRAQEIRTLDQDRLGPARIERQGNNGGLWIGRVGASDDLPARRARGGAAGRIRNRRSGSLPALRSGAARLPVSMSQTLPSVRSLKTTIRVATP